MNVLTWHGAVLRVDGARQRLVQDPVWMSGSDGQDFVFNSAAPSALQIALGGLTLEAAGGAGMVRFSNAAGVLSAASGKRDVTMEPDEGQSWQTFLLIGPDDLADLRHIMAHRWRVRPSGQILEKADIRLVPGFTLAFGPYQIDLGHSLPLTSYTRRVTARGATYAAPPSFVIRPGDDFAKSVELADGSAQHYEMAREFELLARRTPPPPEVGTREVFMRTQRCSLTLPAAPPLYAAPPLVTRARDRELFAAWLETQTQPAVGFVPETLQIRREQKRYVMLARGCEGMIFDQDGSTGDLSALSRMARLPHGITERRGRLWASRDALEEAPRLDGPLVVFYDAGLDGYANWLTGAMPALDAVMRYAPRGARLLLPASSSRTRRGPDGFEHREVINLAGFSRMTTIESGADIVWADDVLYPAHCAPECMPAAQLQDFRTRVLLPFDGPGEPTKRIFIKRGDPGSLQPGHEVEQYLTEEGFEHVVLEQLSQHAQLDLFRQAAFVVAAHGEDLANVIFSPPGLRVIELMSNAHFRPETWRLCGRLGHLYAYLGCEVEGEESEARLVPDAERFRDLLQMTGAFRL